MVTVDQLVVQLNDEQSRRLRAQADRDELSSYINYLWDWAEGLEDVQMPLTLDQYLQARRGGKVVRRRATFREVVTQFLDESNLRTVSFDLGVQYDALTGDNLVSKVVSLIIICERDRLMDELVDWLVNEFPAEDWKRLAKNSKH